MSWMKCFPPHLAKSRAKRKLLSLRLRIPASSHLARTERLWQVQRYWESAVSTSYLGGVPQFLWVWVPSSKDALPDLPQSTRPGTNNPLPCNVPGALCKLFFSSYTRHEFRSSELLNGKYCLHPSDHSVGLSSHMIKTEVVATVRNFSAVPPAFVLKRKVPSQ